jgi:GAF domain-containing protein
MTPAPKRRWFRFQFRLSTLLWLMTTVALSLLVAIQHRKHEAEVEQLRLQIDRQAAIISEREAYRRITHELSIMIEAEAKALKDVRNEMHAREKELNELRGTPVGIREP